MAVASAQGPYKPSSYPVAPYKSEYPSYKPGYPALSYKPVYPPSGYKPEYPSYKPDYPAPSYKPEYPAPAYKPAYPSKSYDYVRCPFCLQPASPNCWFRLIDGVIGSHAIQIRLGR